MKLWCATDHESIFPTSDSSNTAAIFWSNWPAYGRGGDGFANFALPLDDLVFVVGGEGCGVAGIKPDGESVTNGEFVGMSGCGEKKGEECPDHVERRTVIPVISSKLIVTQIIPGCVGGDSCAWRRRRGALRGGRWLFRSWVVRRSWWFHRRIAGDSSGRCRLRGKSGRVPWLESV